MTTTPLLSLFLLIISIYSSLFNHVVVSAQCLSHQQSLLLQLKDSLIFNPTEPSNLVKWNQSSDCCSWAGISCEEGRVTGLNLRNESISGGISENSTLWSLIYLKTMDLSDNSGLNSTIPSRIGNLTNLSYLKLSSSFSGQIPKEISRLKKLRILDLSYFGSYHESSNLSMLVQNLTQLEELFVDGVNISAPGNQWGQALSSSLPNLRVLSLYECGLSGPIHQSLAKLQYLSVIQLSRNNFSSLFPRFFVDFSNLTSLQLSSCGLYGRFPNEIFHTPTLRVLDMSDNGLLEGSLPEFSTNNDLQLLDISATNFKGRLPSSISNLGQLTDLDLSNCHFSGPFPKSIAKLTQLVHLGLSNNQFVGPIPSFDMTKNLERIHLSSNNLSGPISSAHLEGLLNLIDIDLSNNSFNGNIPSSLFTLPLLELIDLSNNQFSGQILEFPNAPSSMLKDVRLSGNKLHGPIPMSIFKLRTLNDLSLSSNKFNGTIQLDMIGSLSNLQILDLSYNNMSINVSGNGSNIFFLPNLYDLRLASCNIRKFPSLSTPLANLDLSSNQIDGEIPTWIWNVVNLDLNLSNNHLTSIEEPYNIPFLFSLDLSFNQLHGKIPILPANAFYIDLSRNSFTSSIPSDIGKNLRNTLYFSLSNNGLSGSIPESICNARDLILVIDLSHNNLSGMIPTCMFALSQTTGIKLGRNNLSGPIPDAFPVDCSLRTLDLNGNLLTHRIPKSLANCKALEDLDLGNNHLIDTFPMLLKEISTLRVLILRSNKFYGHITCTESIGSWSMIQIVDIAFNNFSGELPGKCLTKWHKMMAVKDYSHDYPKLHFTKKFGLITLPFTSRDLSEPKYKDSVFVTNKGLEMEYLKIANGFTSIDFSSNNFHGEIPMELGQLNALHVLNLSNNVLSGQIPSSFGNMQQLESLDLKRNQLKGNIPTSISNLNFLSVLNLSYNQLNGRIPTGSQIQTFPADGFKGNEGLCGPPLPDCPGDHEATDTLPDTPKGNKEIEWNLISAEIGFIVGFGAVIGPLVFWKRWRKWYFDRAEDIAFSILPQKLLRKWLSWKMGTRRSGVRVGGRRGVRVGGRRAS